MSPSWREIYSHHLDAAMAMYVNGDLIHLQRQLNIMAGMIHDDAAMEELKKFTEEVEKKYQIQVAEIDREAKHSSNPISKEQRYQRLDEVLDWKLEQILCHHQYLCRRYSLLPMVSA